MQPGPYRELGDYSTGRQLCDLAWVSGVTGAVPASFPSGFARASSDAIKSVTRISAGVFTIGLNNQWVDLLFVTAWVLQAASQAVLANYSAAGVVDCILLQNLSTAATPTITIGTLNGSGALTDPTTGDQVHVHIEPQFFQNGVQQ